ncbi:MULTISPECIES: hypothetical protein [Streptomyces]|uniref:hypothetical protein n=1 Tax=Streptomyces TaxID=1883 RepID=UPI00199D721D|nr:MULTISPECIES: hypothetical protein [Streptomyces]MCM3266102.1 hypothetical protein [Streptomyces thermoviolaceus]WTD49210.1 hypothetical protein OG899_17855 [Streptomyces thermoviolaceus]GGV80246.1 hypothetical protein GCM10010499_42840 [Streptomyces thermoviolaceus subsp. apingens]GHB10322.1 hypothetical protein GCM10010512_47260 [Streptomyces thermoviolaceus subsp. thermoviolaceus]
MAASAQLLLSALSGPEAFAGYESPLGGAESACAEAPLTSEPPLPDTAPLTSEPPLAETAPLTSEATTRADGCGLLPAQCAAERSATAPGRAEP